MTYLADWADAERRQNPDKFDNEMDAVRFRDKMRKIKLATVEVAADFADAADRLEEIFAC